MVSDYQDANVATDFTRSQTKGMMTQNKISGNSVENTNTNAMYFPETADHVSVNNSYTYHNHNNQKSLINNKFGGAGISNANQTRFVNKVNKYYQDGILRQNSFRSGKDGYMPTGMSVESKRDILKSMKDGYNNTFADMNMHKRPS